jgi:hypothetical protein
VDNMLGAGRGDHPRSQPNPFPKALGNNAQGRKDDPGAARFTVKVFAAAPFRAMELITTSSSSP